MDTTKENALREQSVHFKTPSTDYSATPNIEPMFVSGFGQFHTNEPAAENPNKKLTPYVTINLPGIRALVDNPQSVDKAEGQWLIASTLPCRTFATQEQSGEFWMLWADLDLEPKPLNEVAEVLDAIIPGCDREQYTSRSAQENNPKSRILIPLIKPLCGGDFLLCQEVLNDKLAERGLTPDRATERAGQLCYLPNRGDFYQSLNVRDGNCFDPLTEWALEISAKRAAIAEHERALHSEAQAAAIRREALKLDGDNPDLIGAFNAAYTVQEILVRAGYKQRGNTFRHPLSESGSYSASVKNGRVHSMSSNDPLYTGGGGVGAHDAFSAFCVLFAGGDQPAALKLAGEQWLSIGGESWNTVKQRDYMRRKAAAESQDTTDKHRIVALDYDAILTMHFPPMEPMLSPWLCRQHLSLIHAWRGVGKTHFALGVAYAVASGGEYLKWTADKPFRVVYVDGEMSGAAIQARLVAIARTADKHPPQGYLQIITPDAQALPLPDLATPEGQAALAPRIADADLIVVDNLSCLMRTGEENKAEGWHSTVEWALDLKRQGKTVLFVGHDGKNRERRGSSKVEDILDCVLHLTHEADYDSEKGAAFTCAFVKGRHLTGKDGAAIEAALDKDTGKWTWLEAALKMADRIRKLHAEVPSMSQKDIADELDCSRATVSRALKQ